MTADVSVPSIPHYLNGARVEVTDGRHADVFNPSTGAVQASVPLASTAARSSPVSTPEPTSPTRRSASRRPSPAARHSATNSSTVGSSSSMRATRITAEIVVDITTTGATLSANALKVLDDGVILASEANLVASVRAPWGKQARDAAAAILDYAVHYAQSEHGRVPFKDWPQGVKGHFITRTPPPGFVAH